MEFMLSCLFASTAIATLQMIEYLAEVGKPPRRIADEEISVVKLERLPTATKHFDNPQVFDQAA